MTSERAMMDGPEYMLLEEVKAIKKEVEDEESFYNRLKKNATKAFLETSNHEKLKERLMKMTEDDKRSWQAELESLGTMAVVAALIVGLMFALCVQSPPNPFGEDPTDLSDSVISLSESVNFLSNSVSSALEKLAGGESGRDPDAADAMMNATEEHDHEGDDQSGRDPDAADAMMNATEEHDHEGDDHSYKEAADDPGEVESYRSDEGGLNLPFLSVTGDLVRSPVPYSSDFDFGDFICPPGTTNSSDGCEPCGLYAHKNSSGNGDCTRCPSNSEIENGVLNATDFTQCVCSPGYGGDATTSVGCKECGLSAYKSSSGNENCTLCPSGSEVEKEIVNATSLLQCVCPFGSEVENGVDNATSRSQCVCLPGYGGNATSESVGCKACGSSAYKESSGNKDCTLCPTGQYIKDGGTASTNGSNCDCKALPFISRCWWAETDESGGLPLSTREEVLFFSVMVVFRTCSKLASLCSIITVFASVYYRFYIKKSVNGLLDFLFCMDTLWIFPLVTVPMMVAILFTLVTLLANMIIIVENEILEENMENRETSIYFITFLITIAAFIFFFVGGTCWYYLRHKRFIKDGWQGMEEAQRDLKGVYRRAIEAAYQELKRKGTLSGMPHDGDYQIYHSFRNVDDAQQQSGTDAPAGPVQQPQQEDGE